MADSLVLTGVKDVKKHTGSEMLLTRPKRGGDTHMIKEWWNDRNGKQYCACTVFDVTASGNTVKLALKTNMSTNIRIDHDGAFEFDFYGINEIERACLFTTDLEVIEHYVFPRISGGKVMTVTPAGAAAKPGAGPAPTIGTVTVTGATSPADGSTETYAASISGSASPTYAIASSGGSDTVSGLDVTFSGPGARTLTVTATDASASDNPATGTLSVTVPSTIGTVTITGDNTATNAETKSYTVSISGTASPTYVITSSEGGDSVSGLDVTFNGAGARTLTATATDATASDNGATGTLSVTVS